MGASASTPTSPAVPSSPNDPLHILLTHHDQSLLPRDPHHSFWITLFQRYAQLDRSTYRSRTTSTPVASLVQSTLAHPDLQSTISARTALAITTRAASILLRAHSAALNAPNSSQLPAPSTQILGALMLSRALLHALRASASSSTLLCEILGTLDGAADISHAHRVEIGHSLLWQLAVSALDILTNPSTSHPLSPYITTAAIELILAVLSDQLYTRATPTPHTEHSSDPVDRTILSAVIDRYPNPQTVLTSLLDVIAAAAQYTDTATLLSPNATTRPVPHASSSTPIPSAGLATAPGARTPSSAMAMGVAAFAVSTSALNFQSAIDDAFSALSSRLPLRSLIPSSLTPLPNPPPSPPHPKPRPPSLDTNMVSHFEPDMATDMVQGWFPSPTIDSQAAPNSTKTTPATSTTHVIPEHPTLLAEQALALLVVLCSPRSASPYRSALFSLQDVSKSSVSVSASTDTAPSTPEVNFSFSKLYDSLGKWLAHPRAALLAYYLIANNRRFRTFALARTDPDVLLVPLLASIRHHGTLGGVPADAVIPALITLILTSDKGFCEAIDAIRVPSDHITFIEDRSRLGVDDVALSGLILLVGARVVQQSLVVRRKTPEVFLASACLATMANVAGDVTNLHPLAAERLLTMVDFLGKRRRKALIAAAHVDEMPSVPPPIGDSPRVRSQNDDLDTSNLERAKEVDGTMSSLESEANLTGLLAEFIGTSLEVIAAVLRARSVVSANRHLVYCLLHREAILETGHVIDASHHSQAVGHMLRRVIHFFSKCVDDSTHAFLGERNNRRPISGSSVGISVERVFDVIDKNSRHLSSDVFDGLPELRFTYEQTPSATNFLFPYSWSIATRSSPLRWNLQNVIIPVGQALFQPSR